MRTVAMVVVKMLALAALLTVSSCGRQEDRGALDDTKTPHDADRSSLPAQSAQRHESAQSKPRARPAEAVVARSAQADAAQGNAAQGDVAQERPAPAELRFDMTQNGKAQTAEQFDAWMREQGVRVVESADTQSTDVRSTNVRSTN